MTTLTPPKQPIALRPEHIASKTTKIHINQHSASLSGGKFTISSIPDQSQDPSSPASNQTAEKQTLFTVDGSLLSWTQRRHFRDASGLPLFEIARKSMGVTWYLHLPGSGIKDKGTRSTQPLGDGRVSSSVPASEPIATIVPKMHALKDQFDVHFKNAASSENERVVLEVRGQNVWKSRTHVYYQGKVVMEVRLLDLWATYLPVKRPSWEVSVVEGVDVSLAAVLGVLLATLLYQGSGKGKAPVENKIPSVEENEKGIKW